MPNDRPSEEPEEKSAVKDQVATENESAASLFEQAYSDVRNSENSKKGPEKSSSDRKEKGDLEFNTEDLFAEAYANAGNKSADKAKDAEGKVKDGTNKNQPVKDSSVAEFSKWLKSNFNNFDADKDGKLDQQEVEKQVLNPANKGKDAIYAATLNSEMLSIEDNFSKQALGRAEKGELENIPSPDEGSLKNTAVSRESVEAFSAFANDENKLQNARGEVSVVRGYNKFDHLDTDKSSRVTKDELKAALEDKKWNENDRETFKQMLARYDSIAKSANEQDLVFAGSAVIPGEMPRENPAEQKAADETISQRDLGKTGKPQSFALTGAEESVKRHTERLNKFLADETGGKKCDINQGAVNDCFFVSPMKELTKREPEALSKLVTDNKDGTHSVKFPDSEKVYTVNAPTQAELASYTNNKNSAILEKAYGQRYKEEHPDKKTSLISTESLDFGNAADAIRALTGSKAENVFVGDGSESLKLAKEASEKGEILVAGSNEWTRKDGIQSRHAYGMSYNKETGKIVLENPYPARDSSRKLEPIDKYGKALDGNLDGKFELTAEEFAENFDHISREIRKKK
jgi:hypothetical protein